jgi:hypothetical protein
MADQKQLDKPSSEAAKAEPVLRVSITLPRKHVFDWAFDGNTIKAAHSDSKWLQ